MKQINLQIEILSLDKLTPYEKNCKIHTPEQIRHIANSIEQFRFNDPLGVSGENNIVLEGNGRLGATSRPNAIMALSLSKAKDKICTATVFALWNR